MNDLNPEIGKTRSRGSIIFLYALLFANVFLPLSAVSVMSVLYIGYYLMVSKFSFPKELLVYFLIPGALILIGIRGIMDNLYYDVFKDAWYFINPVLVLCAGYLAMRRIQSFAAMLRVIAIGGGVLGAYHLFKVATDPQLLLYASVQDVRKEYGNGYFLTLLSFVVLWFRGRYGLTLFDGWTGRKATFVIYLIDSLSLILSFSRALWFSLLLVVFAMKGLLTSKKAMGALMTLFALIALTTIVAIFPPAMRSDKTIVGKLSNSIDEVLFRPYVSREDIQSHWRGYESYMAMRSFLSGGWGDVVFGHGFGALVDVKVVMLLGGEKFRFIPILHNGYMYVLVKTGIVGFILYDIFLYAFYRKGKRIFEPNKLAAFVGNLIVALTLVLAFTTFVISGWFNSSALVSVVLLLGALLSFGKNLEKYKGGMAACSDTL